MSNDHGRLAGLRRAMEVRSRAHRLIRDFFQERGYLEVETPVRLASPALETHIDAEPSGGMYLRTSPELHMKRLLAAGYERIYQIGPCFRKGESGNRHHPEYTMLEWYATGTDYQGILEETKALIRHLSKLATPDCRVDFGAEWHIVTVSDAFISRAGWDPAASYDEVRFNLDLVEKVEPALHGSAPVVLTDYPSPAAAFSRLKPGNPRVAERWELYMDGLEIANAYTELTDAVEQRRRFEASARERASAGKPVYAIDEAFMTAMENGLPPCAGIALGFDRLIMALTGATSIGDVIAFREDESIQ